MEHRLRVALGGLLALSCTLVACGGEDAPVAETPPPTCGGFCRQAGGFGAGDEPEEMPVEIPAQEIAVTEGVAEVRVTCNLDVDCVGAIILGGRHVPEYGRADLDVPAGADATVRVAITPEGLEALETRGDDPETVVTVPLVDASQPLSFSDFVTIQGR